MTRRALVTGVGRLRGIGAGIAAGLAEDGWDLVLSSWQPYDARLGLVGEPDDPEQLADRLRAAGRRVELLETDLEQPDQATGLVDRAADLLGPSTRWSCRTARASTRASWTPPSRASTGTTPSTSGPPGC